MVHAAHAWLDDRGRIGRDPQEPHRRACLRPPLRSARPAGGRGGVTFPSPRWEEGGEARSAAPGEGILMSVTVSAPPPQPFPASGGGSPGAMLTLRQALLSPRSVAIVGQSNDPAKTAGRPLKFLRQAGYAGRVYPVNARRDEVLGERAFASLAALPEVPEHVYVVTPTEAAVEAIEEGGRLGVKVAPGPAGGVARAGPAGR